MNIVLLSYIAVLCLSFTLLILCLCMSVCVTVFAVLVNNSNLRYRQKLNIVMCIHWLKLISLLHRFTVALWVTDWLRPQLKPALTDFGLKPHSYKIHAE